MREVNVKSFLFLGCALASAVIWAGAAVPEVSNIKIGQRGGSGVKVTYDLSGADGIITVDFLTNGVSVGRHNISALKGDVGKLVQVGQGKSIYWKPSLSWPESQEVGSAVLTVEIKARAVNTPPDYLVVDLDNPTSHRYYETAEEVPGGVTNRRYKTSEMVFRRIHAANVAFPMGSPSTEVGRMDKAWQNDSAFFIGKENIHTVSLTNDFYIGIYEVTQEQYRRIMDKETASGGFTEGDDAKERPQTVLSRSSIIGNLFVPSTHSNRYGIESAASLIGKFRAKTGFAKCSLPTEVEWEFACRAGEYAAFYWGGNLVKGEDGKFSSSDIDDYAWYEGNSKGTTHPVGLKKPNSWGLYDMLGNAAEATLDLTRTWIYTKEPYYAIVSKDNFEVLQAIDPLMHYGVSGTTDWNDSSLIRGGSYWEPVTHCRSAARTVQKGLFGKITTDAPNGGKHLGCRLAIRLD